MKTYTVKENDTLWRIAKDNNVTVEQLKMVNNLTSDIIKVGQVLKIPEPAKEQVKKSEESARGKFSETNSPCELEVKCSKPDFVEGSWLDKNDKEIKEAMVGDEVKIMITTKNMEVGTPVTIKIKNADNKQQLATINGKLGKDKAIKIKLLLSVKSENIRSSSQDVHVVIVYETHKYRGVKKLHFDASAIVKGEKVYKEFKNTILQVKPKPLIRIAWTIDDGITGKSIEIENKLLNNNCSRLVKFIPATWFVDRSLSKIDRLIELQNKGHEIGIHTYHKKIRHHCWFPTGTDTLRKAYTNMKDSMRDFCEYTKYLRDNGLKIKFVRPPGGLVSELMYYCMDKKVEKERKRAGYVARRIIKGEDISSYGKEAIKIKRDFELLVKTIGDLGLHLWDGSSSGGEIGTQSWDVESKEGKESIYLKDRFSSRIKKYTIFSLIVLTHEKYPDDMCKDIKWMESKNVIIEYYTLSDLYEKVRGRKP